MAQLFIGPNALGDAVLATGLLDWMARQHADGPVTVACGPPAALVFSQLPGLADIHIMRKQPRAGHWIALWREVRRQRWRRVVDLRRSAMPWLLRADARHVVPRGRPSEHRVILASRTLGLPPQPPCMWLTDQQRAQAMAMLPSDRPALAIGSGANWICKTWPAERYAELARRLTGPGGLLAGGRVVLVGSPAERAAAAPIRAAIGAVNCLDAFDLGIPGIAALMERSTLFVGNDSGMMHLAAATGVRTVGLFGPTREEYYGPWGPNALVVRTVETVDDLLSRIKPPQVEHCLMEGLAVEAVVEAISRRWPALPLGLERAV